MVEEQLGCLGVRFGAGRTVVACRAAMPAAGATSARLPGTAALAGGRGLGGGQLLYGLALGIENGNEMGYRQAVTPDALQGRMNTTMRSVNRAMVVFGAPLGGVVADTLGYRPALWIGAGGVRRGQRRARALPVPARPAR
jgi:MFS family permease